MHVAVGKRQSMHSFICIVGGNWVLGCVCVWGGRGGEGGDETRPELTGTYMELYGGT